MADTELEGPPEANTSGQEGNSGPEFPVRVPPKGQKGHRGEGSTKLSFYKERACEFLKCSETT